MEIRATARRNMSYINIVILYNCGSTGSPPSWLSDHRVPARNRRLLELAKHALRLRS